MRKLILAVVVAALVPVPVAEATYHGSINAGNYTVNFGSPTAGACAATGMLITKAGRMDVDYVISTLSGSGASEVHTVPINAVRLVIEIDSGRDGHSCVMQVVQGGRSIAQVDILFEGRLVFDVVS